jgi:wyosine [tRNA(Phe)-imidazoG37] synthetase (radical SAM superfamily)
MKKSPLPGSSLFADHQRDFENNRYVYPVLSRRSGGISIGINLNRDKACNFDCVYCQVDRSRPGESEAVDLPRLLAELDQMIALVTSERIFEQARFGGTPEPLRRLRDIAFSGDGEPTAHADFDRVVAACADVRRRHKLDDVKLVLLTNASLLHRPHVRRALAIFDAEDGEIWAKLDAGTEAYYGQIARSKVPFRQILDNLRDAAQTRPIVIQSLFMRIVDEPPSLAEQEAYCERLGEIVAAGGRIKLVQLHTVARSPAESWVTPLPNAELDVLAKLVRERTGLPVATFYG